MAARLRAAVCLGLIAGLLLSPKLWLSTRNYPLTPVLASLRPIPPPVDHLVFVSMLLLLGLIVVAPRPAKWIAIFVFVAVAYALFDQQRWQPWFYQYLFMLMAVGLAKPGAAFNTCRLIVVSIYFWSGIQKINPGFIHETFSWMLTPLTPLIGSAPHGMPAGLAFAAPILESAIAIGLLTRKFRGPAVLAAIAMHAFILVSIGPFGHNHNRVVWPWNLAMCVFVVLLFRRTPEVGARPILCAGYNYHKLVFLLFAVMPALSLADLWDSYLSFALYSGNQKKATIYMADAVAGKLPDEVQEIVGVYDSEFHVDTLDVDEWSFAELNVPAYPEIRVFRNVARKVCADSGNSPQMLLAVEGKRMYFHRARMSLYTCAMLQR